MPSPFTSTFASAAAGSNGDTSAPKRDGSGATDWSRSRPNGATHTFRRTSASTIAQTRDSQPSGGAVSNPGVYVPPHLNSSHPSYRNGTPSGTRYTKDQLLEIYHTQKDAGLLSERLGESFVGDWDPTSDKNSVLGRNEKDQYPGPESCWNYAGNAVPLGLVDMTEEEKQLYTTSVNSPIKMVQSTKDTNTNTPAGARKASLSTYSSTSGNVSRPGTRRRDTSDSLTANGPLSPTESKTYFQQPNTATPPPALLRRLTDFKDDEPSPDAKDISQDDGPDRDSMGSLRRIGTAPSGSTSSAMPPSPWSAGPNSSGFGGMGAFGSLNLPSTQESAEKRPGFGSARGSSRFKDLLAKASTEDFATGGKEKTMFGGLEKLPEEDGDATQSRMRDMFKTRPNRSETNPYEEDPGRASSAAMNTTQDGGFSSHAVDSLGFSAFSSERGFGGEHPSSQSQSRYGEHEPLSPANTNPYQSPQGPHYHDDGRGSSDLSTQHGLPPFGAGRRSLFDSESSSRGFGNLPGFGPWSSAGLGSEIPARDRNVTSSTFGDPIFSPLGDLQSPGAGIGAGFFGGGGGGFGAAGRSNRLGAILPHAMQDQMRGDMRSDISAPPIGSRPESAQQETAGHDPFDGTFARGSGAFGANMEGNARVAGEGAPGFGPPGAAPNQPPIGPPPTGQRASTSSDPEQLSQDGQLPTAQQRQMVMPDRMRWIYRDPSGQVQGPWSGLEMHDWFKAGFFTAELLVKKVEDTEFEPLAQLVRRIGNSREPFLVPQIGVPHGPTAAAWSTPATTAATTNPTATAGPPQAGNAQPPFASAFPSFGTTLTAEQQNALERRKQEEQYLMARQKEHLAQQQAFMRQQQIPNGPHALHQGLQHHSSQHSLHSQPSFGSIASPNPPFHSPMPGQIPSHQVIGPPPTSAGHQAQFGREPELYSFMDRLNLNQRLNFPSNADPLGAPGDPNPAVAQMLQDRARLQPQSQGDMRGHQEAFLGQQGRNDRLEEFNELRSPAEAGLPGPDSVHMQPIGAQRHLADSLQQQQPTPIGHPGAIQKPAPQPEVRASLTEQIQRTAEWQEQQRVLPPPVSISPLPAPAAQRNRQHVAESLVHEPRSETETPVETPTSLAPWAQQPAEALRGPSLKEIQEAEAKKAAEQELIAAEARRIAAEHERVMAANAPPPAPGLPATSTWGQSISPGTPSTPTVNAWAKSAPKPAATTSSKKTLAQIQKEEEARKTRQAAAAAAVAAQATLGSNAAGKRYAELASKAAQAQTPALPAMGTGAWTTVGSSGKAKAPVPGTVIATPQPSTANRAVSGAATTVTAAAKKPPVTTAKSTTPSLEKAKAEEEFKKWLKSQLSKGLNSGISVDDFVSTLLSLPAEVEIVQDSVYSASQTLDGRRIAEEFVRRRKLADKGVVVDAGAVNGVGGDGAGGQGIGGGATAGGVGRGAGGGWSEVAKKGPAAADGKKDGSNGNGAAVDYKVVSKKKGKR